MAENLSYGTYVSRQCPDYSYTVFNEDPRFWGSDGSKPRTEISGGSGACPDNEGDVWCSTFTFIYSLGPQVTRTFEIPCTKFPDAPEGGWDCNVVGVGFFGAWINGRYLTSPCNDFGPTSFTNLVYHWLPFGPNDNMPRSDGSNVAFNAVSVSSNCCANQSLEQELVVESGVSVLVGLPELDRCGNTEDNRIPPNFEDYEASRIGCRGTLIPVSTRGETLKKTGSIKIKVNFGETDDSCYSLVLSDFLEETFGFVPTINKIKIFYKNPENLNLADSYYSARNFNSYKVDFNITLDTNIDNSNAVIYNSSSDSASGIFAMDRCPRDFSGFYRFWLNWQMPLMPWSYNAYSRDLIYDRLNKNLPLALVPRQPNYPLSNIMIPFMPKVVNQYDAYKVITDINGNTRNYPNPFLRPAPDTTKVTSTIHNDSSYRSLRLFLDQSLNLEIANPSGYFLIDTQKKSLKAVVGINVYTTDKQDPSKPPAFFGLRQFTTNEVILSDASDLYDTLYGKTLSGESDLEIKLDV